MEAEGKIMADYLLEWHQKYGPVIKFQLLDRIVLSTIDPAAVKVSLFKTFDAFFVNYKVSTW